MGSRATRPVMERLIEKIEKTESGCWMFTGYIGKEGFGRIGGVRSRKVRQAHHVAWESIHGPLKKGEHIHQTCGHKACCNPGHLERKARARTAIPIKGVSLEERLDRRLDKSGKCWLWTGSRFPYGYGRLTFHGESMYTHRAAWIAANGPIPKGQFVLHDCDTPPCCNPDHLHLGDALLNAQERDGRGRNGGHKTRGEKCFKAKLTDSQVLAMRRRFQDGTATITAMAAEYGVHYTTIFQVVKFQTWKHLGTGT